MRRLSFNEYSSIYTDRATEKEFERYNELLTAIEAKMPFENASSLSVEELEEKVTLTEVVSYCNKMVMVAPSLGLSLFSFQSKADPNMAELTRFENFYMNNLKTVKKSSDKLNGILSYIESHSRSLPLKNDVFRKMKNDFTTFFNADQPIKQLKLKIEMKEELYKDGIDEAIILNIVQAGKKS